VDAGGQLLIQIVDRGKNCFSDSFVGGHQLSFQTGDSSLAAGEFKEPQTGAVSENAL
jgi:hypothetical protein